MEKSDILFKNEKIIKKVLLALEGSERAFDEELLAGIVAYLGDRLKDRDSALIACSDKKEKQAVKQELLIGIMGLPDGKELDQMIDQVCKQMKIIRMKPTPSFYYFVAANLKKAGKAGLANFFKNTSWARLPTTEFYHVFCEAMSLDKQTFQLIQGGKKLSEAQVDLYHFVDGIPAPSLVTYYQDSPSNTLSQNMMLMLNDALDSNVKAIAEQNFENPSYWVGGVPSINPSYTPGLETVDHLLARGSSAIVEFDAQASITDPSGTWTANMTGASQLFWNGGLGALDLNRKAMVNNISAEIEFDSFAYAPVRAGAWFTTGFFTYQQQNPDKWVVDQRSPSPKSTWHTVFGPKGTCQYLTNQVLIVDGFALTVTSHASYTTEEFDRLQNYSNMRVWPFYFDRNTTLLTQTFTMNQDNSISITVISKPGNLYILGIGVVPTIDVVSNQTPSRLI